MSEGVPPSSHGKRTCTRLTMSVRALEEEEPSWVEEREVETSPGPGRLALKQIALQWARNAKDGGLHAIPGNLSTRQRLIFQTTQANEGHGAVRDIKCNLCPRRDSTWESATKSVKRRRSTHLKTKPGRRRRFSRDWKRGWSLSIP
ncbi:hypothetical protein EI94DRAFT_1697923 [Lactarius quietus]|nr:hypothetical protein EI94DRAFT_1697923 [Lactarius quietus]